MHKINQTRNMPPKRSGVAYNRHYQPNRHRETTANAPRSGQELTPTTTTSTTTTTTRSGDELITTTTTTIVTTTVNTTTTVTTTTTTTTTTSNSSSAAALSNCKLPLDIIASILCRLPVKTLICSKLVCKPFCSLISTPEFHHLQRTHSQNSESLIIHSYYPFSTPEKHIISLYNPHSAKNQTTIIKSPPFPAKFPTSRIVASLDGLVCLSFPPANESFVLWNPATRMSVEVTVPNLRSKHVQEEIMSFGLAYDERFDEYKVVMITCFRMNGSGRNLRMSTDVRVYSTNSGEWKVIAQRKSKKSKDRTFQFYVLETSNDVIINGVPYWTVFVGTSSPDLDQVLLSYDVHDEVFNRIALPKVGGDSKTTFTLVEFKGSLAALVYSSTGEFNDYINVMLYDDKKSYWSMKFTLGPFRIGRELLFRPSQLTRERKLLMEGTKGELFFYDPEGNLIEELEIEGTVCVEGQDTLMADYEDEFFPYYHERHRTAVLDEENSFAHEALNYAESFVYVKGMKQVGLK